MQLENMSSSDETQTGDVDSNTGVTYAERRKWSKPVMEKKRRARINNSLNELKAILLEALKKDSTRHSKLEKADILEMTVNYLKSVNTEKKRLSVSLSIDPTVVDKYRAGFNECRNEVMRFLSTCEGVTVDVRTRLLSRLASCSHSIRSRPNAFNEPDFEPAYGITDPIADGEPSATTAKVQNSNNAKKILPSETFNPASTRQPMVANVAPRFDSKMQKNSGISQTPRNAVLSENVQLAPATAINGFEAGIGNVAFLLPAQGTGTTFITPVASASSVVPSLGKHSSQSQMSVLQCQGSTGENRSRGESATSPRGPNIILLQPVFQPVASSPVVSPVDNKLSNISDTSSGYQAGDDRNSISSRLSVSPYKPNNTRHGCDSSDKNVSFSSSEDPMGSDCEKRGSSRGNLFEEKSKKIAQVRPLDSIHHANSSLYQKPLEHGFLNQYAFTNPRDVLSKCEEDTPHISKHTSKRVCEHPGESLPASSKRSRLSASSSTGDSSLKTSQDKSLTACDNRNQHFHEWNRTYEEYHASSIYPPADINVTTSVNSHLLTKAQTSDLMSNERNVFFINQSISPHSVTAVTTSNSNPANNKPNPWRPWSKTFN